MSQQPRLHPQWRPTERSTIPSVIQTQYPVVPQASQDFYVKELRYDRADALNGPVDVSRRNSDSAAVEVLISRNVGQIDGVILDERGQQAPGVQAVLIPDRRDRIDLYRNATADQAGRFTMRGITPGDYKLFAWVALENFGYFDGDVIRRSDSPGKAVHVAEAAKQTAEVKIIPAQ